MRASATREEGMRLLSSISATRTMPLIWTNSSPRLSVTRFCPCTSIAPVARPAMNFMPRTSDVLIDIFEHLVGRRDHLRIDLIGALGLDHVDQLLDDID